MMWSVYGIAGCFHIIRGKCDLLIDVAQTQCTSL